MECRQLSTNCNYGTSTVLALSAYQAPGVAQRRACQQQRPYSTSCNCGISTASSPTAPQKSAGSAQPGHRTPCQWTAPGESQWSAELDHGKRPLRHDSDVNDLDMHNNGRVNNQSKMRCLALCVPVCVAYLECPTL